MSKECHGGASSPMRGCLLTWTAKYNIRARGILKILHSDKKTDTVLGCLNQRVRRACKGAEYDHLWPVNMRVRTCGYKGFFFFLPVQLREAGRSVSNYCSGERSSHLAPSLLSHSRSLPAEHRKFVWFYAIWHFKGALCSFGEEIQTQDFFFNLRY